MSTAEWPVDVVTVGAILRARTRDTQGNEVGTFNDDTRPNGDQVLSLVAVAVSDLASMIGHDIEEMFWEQAAVVSSYKSAMLVELSYFPEQVATGRSPYAQLKELYDEALNGLKIALAGAGTDLPGDGSGFPSPPSYAFPLGSTTDHLLGPLPGGYVVPYGGSFYQ